MNVPIQTPSSVLVQAEVFQRLVEGITDYAIYMLSPEGYVSSWNAGAQRFKGYTPAEIIGKHFSLFYTPEDKAINKPVRALATARDAGKFEDEGWRMRKDGTRFWASVLIDPIRDAQGKLIGFAKVTRDITERREAQLALRESEERFRLLVQGVTDYAIYMLSPTGIVTNWNAGAARIKQYSHDDIVGQHFSKFYTEEDRANGLPARALAISAAEGRFENEGWRVRKDGSKFWAHVVVDPIRNDNGELIGFAKVTRDVTERLETTRKLKRTEEALFLSQKLEAVGKLTGGVAHDFNNILQVIGGSLQLLQIYIGNNPQAAKRLESALGAVERGSKLSSQLLAFARRQPLQPTVVNPGKIVHGMEELASRALGERVDIETVVSASVWNIQVDPNQLENVILNLAINARDAMPDGGKLTVEVSNVMLDETFVMARGDVAPGQYVLIAVSDTGIGMSPEVLSHACEPFFTTKAEGKGSGLGLSMAYGFVKQSGGHFDIYSEVGDGTVIKMYFPRTFEKEVEAVQYGNRPVVGGTETILVVEDDMAVQSTVVEMLTNLGYKVLKANSADNALVILESGVPVDLLFTDVIMPGKLRSPELAKKAKELHPNIEVLFTSGYTQNAIVHGGRLDPGISLLSKPYAQDQLARKLRHLLSNRQHVLAAQRASRSGSTKQSTSKELRVLVVEDVFEAQQIACAMAVELGYEVKGVADPEEALKMMEAEHFDVLLVDYCLPKMNGVEMAQIAKVSNPMLKVIFASGNTEQFDHTPPFRYVSLSKPFDADHLAEALELVQTLADAK